MPYANRIASIKFMKTRERQTIANNQHIRRNRIDRSLFDSSNSTIDTIGRLLIRTSEHQSRSMTVARLIDKSDNRRF